MQYLNENNFYDDSSVDIGNIIIFKYSDYNIMHANEWFQNSNGKFIRKFYAAKKLCVTLFEQIFIRFLKRQENF